MVQYTTLRCEACMPYACNRDTNHPMHLPMLLHAVAAELQYAADGHAIQYMHWTPTHEILHVKVQTERSMGQSGPTYHHITASACTHPHQHPNALCCGTNCSRSHHAHHMTLWWWQGTSTWKWMHSQRAAQYTSPPSMQYRYAHHGLAGMALLRWYHILVLQRPLPHLHHLQPTSRQPTCAKSRCRASTWRAPSPWSGHPSILPLCSKTGRCARLH